ncbi:hypothetical protein [Elizabethkingia sp. M8]|uniref:hypothetical protein n=1 Tax=Elizabethkingia sp. M8 TaxID=2796140 RepID=UPI001906426F|nr:hypothetical protein [Elizabethkingia sp. M8]QQM26572.1 hypothetical protein JCR23_17295 [Elizabethkingia sp. M8]
MRRIIFIILLTFIYNVKAQKNPVYREVSICGQEGMTDNAYFDIVGEKKYLSIIEEFERKLKKTENNYSNYYRLYVLPGGIKPTDLLISLIPKNLVSEENKKKKEFRVYGSDLTLEIIYDLKAKKIIKLYSRKLNPDI